MLLFPKINHTHSVVFFVLGNSVGVLFSFLNTLEINTKTCLAFCKHVLWSELHLAHTIRFTNQSDTFM